MNIHALSPDPCAQGRLLTIDEARERAAAYALPIGETTELPIGEALERVLAERITARVPLPPFDQSAMDGYALAAGTGLPPGTRCSLAGRIAAGHRSIQLPPGSAVRIFTGAPLPVGADAVVMQEHVHQDRDEIILGRRAARGDNIRRRGEDVTIGDVLISPGERIDPRHLALLAAQGREHVRVYRRPVVAIISTGNELCQPGADRDEAAIYDSNGAMMTALTRRAGFEAVNGPSVPDDPDALARTLRRFAKTCDLIVTTGGASNGDEDHAAAAIDAAGGAFEVLKIAMKPGKPAVVGRIGRAFYLALPGNPVAAFVSWLLLGGAIAATMFGQRLERRCGWSMKVVADFERRPGRTEFVPARMVGRPNAEAVEILGRGGSARLRPLAAADGLAEISPFHAPVKAGSIVAFHPFSSGLAI